VNLKFIGVGLLASVAAVSLTACSGGGSSPGVTAPQQSASTARGTLKLIYSRTKKASSASNARKPAYVSPGETHATLYIDSPTPTSTASATCTPLVTDCTLTFSTTVGTHVLAVEIDDGTNILAEGSASYALAVGDNTPQFQTNPLTLNGVVYGWFLNGTPALGVGSIAVTDAQGYFISSVAGNYDNGPLTIAPSVAGPTITPTDSLTTINLNGTIGFTYSCGALTTPFSLVVNEAATPVPSIPLTLTAPLVYGPPVPPALSYSSTSTANSIPCP
jgi:hypothetical protein